MMTNWIFGIGGAIALVLIVVSLRARHRETKQGTFSFDEVLNDPKTNTTSIARCMLAGGFIVGSFIVVYQTFASTLTDIGYAAYLTAFVAPAVSKIITDNQVERAAATTTPTSVDSSTNVNVDTKKDT